jgi:hypothetical protein
MNTKYNLIRLPDNKPKISCIDGSGKKWKTMDVQGFVCAHVPGYYNDNPWVENSSKKFKNSE